MKQWKRLIIALDMESELRLNKTVRLLGRKIDKFKIGSVAFTRWGPGVVKKICRQGKEVFLDLKFYDIPHTMIKASFAAADLGVWSFTVHLSAGREALEALREELESFCRRRKIRRPLIMGVSELTSKKASLMRVLKLAEVGFLSKIDGIVCAAPEAKKIKEHFPVLKIVTPGIRTKVSDDQQRIATASFAFSQGADYIVVGRPITESPNILKAATELLSR